MTAVEAPSAPQSAPPGGDRGGLHGVRAVAAQEFRMRIRTGRWRWVLAAWFVALAALTVLIRIAVGVTEENYGREGIPVFGALMLLLLGLSLLVVPALTAQSVNGDRERGVLATLQITLLTPTEIAVGKLLAAWGTSLVFLALALPMVIATMFMGGVGPGQAAGALLVVAVLLGVVCAIAQCLSAVLARTITSAVLSYLAVAALTVGTPLAFALALVPTSHEVTDTYTVSNFDPETGETRPGTREETYTYTEARPERVWWLLAPNPFVILADAAPEAEPRRDPRTGEELDDAINPLSELSRAVRDARTPDAPDVDTVGEAFAPGTSTDGAYESTLEVVFDDEPEGSPVWPYGLAFNAALGIGAVALTIRRLRTPARKIPRGTRIA